jgi:hypothetical protein
MVDRWGAICLDKMDLHTKFRIGNDFYHESQWSLNLFSIPLNEVLNVNGMTRKTKQFQQIPSDVEVSGI